MGYRRVGPSPNPAIDYIETVNVNPATGLPAVPGAANADGSINTGGADGTTKAGADNALPVTSGNPKFVDYVIPNGAAIAAAGVQVSGKLVGIIMPAAWTAAGLTFSASATLGGTYYDIYDIGVERTIATAVVAAGAHLEPTSLNNWLAVNFIKLRSGPGASPVNQGASRTFTLVLAG